MATLSCTVETYPIAGLFVIARGAKTEAKVVVATIRDGGVVGRGECVPYARYGETVETVVDAILSCAAAIARNIDRDALQTALPPGAARNAIDCALWDLEAKRSGRRAYASAGLAGLMPVTTAFTISVGTPEAMAEATARAAARPLLKIKLAGEGDADRLRAVRAAAPAAVLIVDANEAWREADLESNMALCADLGIALIEQPLPAGADDLLARVPHLVPICADESIHDQHGLRELRTRYDAINIKLDKTGGLTEAFRVAEAAETLGFILMIGCMVGTSLAMAPALLLTARAHYVDLDGPLLLATDRPSGLRYEGSIVHPADAALWG